MNQAEVSREVKLSIPAEEAYAPVATLALSGLGMVLGLDVDLLGDLRTVASECLDCLMHQAARPGRIDIESFVENGQLKVCFRACERGDACQPGDDLALEITRGVLETLMPQVELAADENGVHGIECSMSV